MSDRIERARCHVSFRSVLDSGRLSAPSLEKVRVVDFLLLLFLGLVIGLLVFDLGVLAYASIQTLNERRSC